MRISPTSLQTWMACPLQYKFKKIEKLPQRSNGKATFGSIVHKALEIYNDTDNMDLATTMFLKYWAEPELMGLGIDYWPKYTSYNSLKAKGVEVLKAYHEKMQWEKRTVIAQEHRFLVPFGEHELEGVVDLVELRVAGNGKRSLRIVDYKTSSYSPTIANLRLNIQFTAYVYASLQPEFWLGNGEKFPPIKDGAALFVDLEKVQRRAIWYHLFNNKELNAGERDDGDFMRLYRLIFEIQKAMDADVFVPDISGDTCPICDFTQQCGITIPTVEQLAQEVM